MQFRLITMVGIFLFLFFLMQLAIAGSVFALSEFNDYPYKAKTILVASTLVAEDDYFVVSGGETTVSVLDNDELNGTKPNNTEVTLEKEGSWPSEFTLQAGGEIKIAEETASGSYNLQYKICESGVTPENCDLAKVTVVVLPEIVPIHICLGNTASLTDGILGPLPADYSLEWYSSTTMSPNTKIDNPAAVSVGTYYAFFIPKGMGTPVYRQVQVIHYDFGESGIGKVNGNDFNWSYQDENAPSNPIVKEITQPGTNHGFTFDIYNLDNSFNMEINGVQLATQEIEFQEDNTLGRNIQFADGDQYEVNTDNIYHMEGTSDHPLIRINISSEGVVSLYGSKVSDGELYPLIPIKGVSNSFQLNEISWNVHTENIIAVTQKVVGRTTMEGQGYGLKTVTHPCLSDIDLKKISDNSEPNIGDTVTFSISVENKGSSDADGVVVTDSLPLGFRYLKSYSFSGKGYDESTGMWDIGYLANRGKDTLWIEAEVLADGELSNVAWNTGATYDPNQENDTSFVSIKRAEADLQISKEAHLSKANIGDQITFIISTFNAGPNAAIQTNIKDVLPAGYQFVDWKTTKGDYKEAIGIWNLDTTQALERDTLWLTAEIVSTKDLENEAIIESKTVDPNPGNNKDNFIVELNQVDLVIKKTVDDEHPYVGDTITFTVNIKNSGPDPAKNIVVKDTLSKRYRYIKSNSNRDFYDEDSREWKMTMDSLQVEGEREIEIKAVVLAEGDSTNVANVNSDAVDLNPLNNIDSTFTSPIPSSDIEVRQVVNNKRPNEGDTVKFVVQVINKGASEAKNVKVMNSLNDGFDLIEVSLNPGTIYNSNTGLWEVGHLPQGDTMKLEIKAVLNVSGTDFSHTAIASNDIYDPNPSNNKSTIQIEPLFFTDLEIHKVVNHNENKIYNNEMVQFEISIHNKGPKQASHIKVVDSFPESLEGSEDIQVEEGQAYYDAISKTLNWEMDSLNAEETRTLMFTARVIAFEGLLENTAMVSADQPDSNTDNNTSTTSSIPIIGEVVFYMPNSFSPNHDGQNDVFKPYVRGQISNFNLQIFNRWGRQVFESHHPEKGWDGTFKGKPAPVGAYVWRVKYDTKMESTIIRKGSCTLVR